MTWTGPLVVVVLGRPAPQGSKRHVGHGVLIESSKHVKPWRVAVAAATAAAIADAARALGGAQIAADAAWRVDLVFTMQRPRAHYRTGRNAGQLRDNAPTLPVVMPDLDKLVRSTLDGIATGDAIANDSRVVELHAVKTYPGGHLDALDEPGVVITLREAHQ